MTSNRQGRDQPAASGGGAAAIARLGALLLALASALLGLAIFQDRQGLTAEYHAQSTVFSDPPTFRHVEGTLSLDRRSAERILVRPEFFSVRWSGWLRIEETGSYRFRGEPREALTVEIAGERFFGTGDAADGATGGPRERLEKGLHRIELRYVRGPMGMRTEWSPPSGRRKGTPEFSAVPSRLLFAERPGALGLALRRLFGGLPELGRKALASALLLAAAGFFFLGRGLLTELAGPLRGWTGRLPPTVRRGAYPAALALLFIGTARAVFPFTAGVMGWDDTYYMHIASRNIGTTWILNRYVHVYLLKLFTWIGGDGFFLGSRLLWSALFAGTVTSLAVAARAAARRWGWLLFAISLFFLLCQPLYFVRIGTAVPDYTVAFFVTAGVALFVVRIFRPSPPRFEWQALWIGAATVAAFKSKELGIILCWLPFLFLWERGRLDLRLFFRKSLAWLGGAAAAYLCLIALDGWILGNPFFSLRPAAVERVLSYNLERVESENLDATWTAVLWSGETILGPHDGRMKYLALAVVLAAWGAVARRKRIEIRLLHLMPLLYFLMLLVLRQRATYALMERYLYPIMPVTALLVALGIGYLGFERLRPRQLLAPLFLIPATGITFLLLAIVVPFQRGTLSANSFLPARFLENPHFSSPLLVLYGNLGPLLLLAALCLAIVFWWRPQARLLLVASLILYTFGAPFAETLFSLRRHAVIQRSENLIYPLRVFDQEMAVENGTRLLIGRDVRFRRNMLRPASSLQRIVNLYFQRWVPAGSKGPLAESDYAILTDREIEWLRREEPELAATARYDPSGILALIEPKRFYQRSEATAR